MHVDNFSPDTYMWILQECDVPYVPDEWNKLLSTYGKDRSKLTGATIVGRYLSKMKLKQYILENLTVSKRKSSVFKELPGIGVVKTGANLNKNVF